MLEEVATLGFVSGVDFSVVFHFELIMGLLLDRESFVSDLSDSFRRQISILYSGLDIERRCQQNPVRASDVSCLTHHLGLGLISAIWNCLYVDLRQLAYIGS